MRPVGIPSLFLLLGWLALTPPALAHAAVATSRTILGAHLEVVAIDLHDPATVLTILLANHAARANSAASSAGDASFPELLSGVSAAAVINGTFFSLDAQKRVMGNMVRAGRFVKYSPRENVGTTFGLRRHNRPELITCRLEGKPDWDAHWFSLTGGPRLVRNGQIFLHPRAEGFADPNVFRPAERSALGFSASGRTLWLASFDRPISLAQEARVMRALGAYQAMNLDGGPSRALAVGDRITVPARCKLTNAIAIYDRTHPAPAGLETAFRTFSGHAAGR